MSKRFEVHTVCHSRALNHLFRAGVSAARVRAIGRVLSFRVVDGDERATRTVLEDLRLPYSVKDAGATAFFRALLRRPALWITALVLGVLVSFGLAGFVWTTRIDCPPSLYAQVYDTLREARLLSPHWRASVDAGDIKRRVGAIEGVSLVSVSIRGVYLTVSVKEELPKGEIVGPQGIIVAECDCIVSRVVVERGRAMVKAGDSVRKGDVLIAPEYLVDKDADVTLPTQAIGTVYGYAYPSYETVYNEHSFSETETGAAYRTCRISVLGRAYGDILPSPYPQYRQQSECYTLGDVLPVRVERVTYYETQTVDTFVPFLTVKEQIIEDSFTQLSMQLKKDVQILRKWCIIDNMGSIYRVRAYAEVEQTVGIYKDEE